MKKTEDYTNEILDGLEPGQWDKNKVHVNGVVATIIKYKESINTIPYQCCPVCNGQGRVLANECTSLFYESCTVCDGNKIIPQHVLLNQIQ